MKLRYYLRGLGIGMVVTALLMGVALKDDKTLSDAEIRVRAMELGMVDGTSRTLADIQASQGEGTPPSDEGAAGMPGSTATPAPSVPTDTPMSTAAPTETVTPESTAVPTPSVSPDSTRSDLISSLSIVALKPPHTPSPDPENTPASEQQESVTFVVYSGQSSFTVSKALAEAGLVEDASEFDRYLDDNGYAKRISTGTYEIPLSSTQEEIAKIITRSR